MLLPKIILSLSLMIPLFGETPGAFLVRDAENSLALPKRFRIMPAEKSCENRLVAPLHVSGSGQFSEKGFQKILETIQPKGPLYVVDLREESHGFIDGMAISWYARENKINFGKSFACIEDEESFLIDQLDKNKSATITIILEKDGRGFFNRWQEKKISFSNSKTEKNELIKSVHYLRFPTSDHHPPTPLVVEKFLAFIESVPPGASIHFHCRGGAGRTTLFMAMIDILQNGCKYTLEQIVERQQAMGGIDLLKELPRDDWKYRSNEERKSFLRNFYNNS